MIDWVQWLMVAKCFKKWLKRAREQQLTRKREHLAEHRHRLVLESKQFQFWMKIQEHKQWYRHYTELADHFHALRLLKQTLSHWASSRDFKSIYKQTHTLPVVYWGVQLLKRSFEQWKLYVKEKRELEREIQQVLVERDQEILKSGFRALFQVYWLMLVGYKFKKDKRRASGIQIWQTVERQDSKEAKAETKAKEASLLV
ncbi:hypothetical protein EDD86DRAFT_55525 [Gorgonomyces haynaldii]|nr:hypothetical protein EDD86DRAFT_55525 [Gorgonomyces haynaldii]